MNLPLRLPASFAALSEQLQATVDSACGFRVRGLGFGSSAACGFHVFGGRLGVRLPTGIGRWRFWAVDVGRDRHHQQQHR